MPHFLTKDSLLIDALPDSGHNIYGELILVLWLLPFYINLEWLGFFLIL